MKDKGYFGICRISTINQKDNNSLSNQKKQIQTYCKNNGINLIGFIEEIESGNRGLERKGIKELQSYIEDGIVEGVIFNRYDRVGRNLLNTLKLITPCILLLILYSKINTVMSLRLVIISYLIIF